MNSAALLQLQGIILNIKENPHQNKVVRTKNEEGIFEKKPSRKEIADQRSKIEEEIALQKLNEKGKLCFLFIV
jgi:hypothetical protein